MTIDQAIKLLEEEMPMPWFVDYPEVVDAIKLSIGALKRIKNHRHHTIQVDFRLLPGETKD